MTTYWYAAVGGEQQGPFSFEDLQRMVTNCPPDLTPTDRLWTDGMEEWVSARSVKGLFTHDPPPLGSSTSVLGDDETPVLEDEPDEVCVTPPPEIPVLQKKMAVRLQGWRARVCAFRDVLEDGDEWFVDNPFVTDSASLELQLDELEAKGGGDEPESLLDGLWKVATCGATEKGDPPDPFKWRHRDEAARVVVVFTDATYHGEMSIEEARGGTWEDVATVVEQKRVIISLFAPDLPCYETLSQIDRSEWWPIPFDKDEKDGAVQGLRDFTSDPSLQRTLLEVVESPFLDLSREMPAPPVPPITFDLDIVFLMDATGSMQPCIDDLKQNIVNVMGQVRGSWSDWIGEKGW